MWLISEVGVLDHAGPPCPSRQLVHYFLDYSQYLIDSTVAEREGFEPSIEFPLYTLSKRAPSTTRPSLQSRKIGADCVFQADCKSLNSITRGANSTASGGADLPGPRGFDRLIFRYFSAAMM